MHPELDELLEGREGNSVVLAFWSTHCPACRDEALSLLELSQSVGGEITFAIVATEPRVDAEAYLAKRRLGHVPLLEDDDLAICDLYQVRAIPALVVLDKRRQVVASLRGPVQENTLQLIRSVLQ